MNFKRFFSFLLSVLILAGLGTSALALDNLIGGPADNSGSSALDAMIQQGSGALEGDVTITTPVPVPTEAPLQTPTPVDPVVDAVVQTEVTLPTPDSSASQVTQTPIPTMDPAIIASEYKITKHPYSENIEVGTSTSFVVKAQNAASVSWTVQDANGNTVDPSQWAAHGISVASSDPANAKIVISKASIDLNNWRFYATFTGYNGVYMRTDEARLTVYYPQSTATQRPVQTPVPTTQPSSTPVPTSSPTPVPTSTVTPTQSPAPVPTPAPTIVPTMEPEIVSEAEGRSSLGTIALIAGGGVVLAAAAVVGILAATGSFSRGGKRRK